MKVICLPPVGIMAALANHIARQEDNNKLEKRVNLEYILEPHALYSWFVIYGDDYSYFCSMFIKGIITTRINGFFL